MKVLIITFLMLSLTAFSGEDHDHGHGKEHGHKKDFVELEDKYIKDLGIKLETVRRDYVGRTIKAPAEVKENPLLSATVTSPVEGIVKEIFVKEGDRVKKGDTIALIYSPRIVELKADLEIAEVKLETAKRIYERDKQLYEQKLIKYTRYYTSLIEYERAKGIYEALYKKLKAYGELKDEYLVIKSPLDGFIVEQLVIKGSPVGLDNIMFKIHSHDVLWVYGYVPYEDSRDLKINTDGIVSVLGKRLPCKIDFIHHEVDEKTRRVKVRCITENKDHILKPGAFVTLEIPIDRKRAILIPKKAVQDIEGEKIVFVRKPKGFEPREVVVGRKIDTYYEIIEGLKEGEVIAVEGTVFLKSKLVGVEAAGHAH